MLIPINTLSEKQLLCSISAAPDMYKTTHVFNYNKE